MKEGKVHHTSEQGESIRVLIKGYLLGNIEAELQEQLDYLMFTDDRVHSELLSVQEELIDDLVAGRLSEPERTHFEDYMLRLPDGYSQLQAARALRGYSSKPLGWNFSQHRFIGSPNLPTYSNALITLLTLAVVALSGLVYYGARQSASLRRNADDLTGQLVSAKAEEANKNAELLQAISEAGRAQSDMKSRLRAMERELRNRKALIAELTPELGKALYLPYETRGAQSIEYAIPRDAKAFEIQVEVGPYNKYRDVEAFLKRDGTTIFSTGHIFRKRVGARSVLSFLVPVRAVSAGDYIIQVNGTDASGRRISRQFYALLSRN
ncbi:MAG: hypothetical protein ACREDR_03605 [Blastocatellia bacterium]